MIEIVRKFKDGKTIKNLINQEQIVNVVEVYDRNRTMIERTLWLTNGKSINLLGGEFEVESIEILADMDMSFYEVL